MLVSEDRVWASDPAFKNEISFQREFRKRFPHCDSMPERTQYLKNETVKRGPDGERPRRIALEVDLATMSNVPQGVPEPIEVMNADDAEDEVMDSKHQVFACVCGKEIKSRLGFISHQRKCKEHLNTRA